MEVLLMITTAAVFGFMSGAVIMLAAIQNEVKQTNRLTIGKLKYSTKRIKE